MAYKRSKLKVSLAALERQIKDHLAEISANEANLAKCQAELLITPLILATEKSLIQATAVRLLTACNGPSIKKDSLRWFFRGYKLTGSEAAVCKEAVRGYNEFAGSEAYIRYDKKMKLEYEILTLKNGIKKCHSNLLQLEESASPMRKKKDSLVELRAAAASNVKETRKIGASVRRGLSLQSWCPYCGTPLGSDPHADHIYPVSKGGRSVPKNMVYVCAQCNIMKTNLTLTMFIKKFSLDREAIEERLSKLHKDF